MTTRQSMQSLTIAQLRFNFLLLTLYLHGLLFFLLVFAIFARLFRTQSEQRLANEPRMLKCRQLCLCLSEQRDINIIESMKEAPDCQNRRTLERFCQTVPSCLLLFL